MKLTDFLEKKTISILAAPTKVAALDAALAMLRDHPAVADWAAVVDAVWQREEALPTGIGLGIGVPHVRCACLRSPVAALVLLHEGVDYGSMDDEPVRVILLIAMPEGMHKEYLQYLATACRKLQERKFRQGLLACASPDEVWEALS